MVGWVGLEDKNTITKGEIIMIFTDNYLQEEINKTEELIDLLEKAVNQV